jgi:hypothetical protein
VALGHGRVEGREKIPPLDGGQRGDVLEDPVGHGVLLVLADGWETSIADYTFDGPDYEDLSDTVGRSVYRATIRGDANFMLTVAAVSARQALIQFKLSASEAAITGSEVQDTYPIT